MVKPKLILHVGGKWHGQILTLGQWESKKPEYGWLEHPPSWTQIRNLTAVSYHESLATLEARELALMSLEPTNED